MTDQPTVSVVVVSHGRPEALLVCLTALSQLDYRNFEIVVVADAQGCDVVGTSSFADLIKLSEFDTANIAMARNIGIAQAAGQIVAFIDDDAIAEPSWLKHLVAPFTRQDVAAVGGFVRGRNGISFQWTARGIRPTTAHVDLRLAGPDWVVPDLPLGAVVKTEGTNMAFRRHVLASSGGFDPVFDFYLDDADANLRLARAGHLTAVAPLAQVHHRVLESVRRKADRTPRRLFEIGRSTVAFCRRHADAGQLEAVLAGLRREQTDRVNRLRAARKLAGRQAKDLLTDLEAGIAEGRDVALPPLEAIDAEPPDFLPVQGMPDRDHVLLAGRFYQRRRLRRRAAEIVAAGQPATVLILTPSTRFHRLTFQPQGYWEQLGGLFGRSDRSDVVFFPHRFRNRVAKERARLSAVRPTIMLD